MRCRTRGAQVLRTGDNRSVSGMCLLQCFVTSVTVIGIAIEVQEGCLLILSGEKGRGLD